MSVSDELDELVNELDKKISKKGKKEKKYEGIVSGLAIDEKLLSTIRKENGNILRNGSVVLESSKGKKIIPVSPAHDAALNGGFKEGTWVVVTGDEKTGKTTLLLEIIAAAQKPENGSRLSVYLDAEGRLKDMNLEGIDGLNPDMVEIINADENALSAEKSLMLLESFMKENENLIIVIDSVSALLPQRDLDSELSGERRPGLPKLFGDFCKKMSGVVPRRNHIVILVTRFIADIGPSRKTKTSDGGKHLRYQGDTMLEVAYIQPWEEGEKRVGQLVHWKVLCSACGGIPGTEYISHLRYGHGIDKTAELIEMSGQFGLIKKSGAWYYLDNEGEELTFQGAAKLTAFLKDNPEVEKKLLTKLKDILS